MPCCEYTCTSHGYSVHAAHMRGTCKETCAHSKHSTASNCCLLHCLIFVRVRIHITRAKRVQTGRKPRPAPSSALTERAHTRYSSTPAAVSTAWLSPRSTYKHSCTYAHTRTHPRYSNTSGAVRAWPFVCLRGLWPCRYGSSAPSVRNETSPHFKLATKGIIHQVCARVRVCICVCVHVCVCVRERERGKEGKRVSARGSSVIACY